MILAAAAFFAALHGLGLLLCRAIERRLPPAFVGCSGLLWGLLAYSLVAMLALGLHIPYTALTMLLGLGAIAILAALACAAQGGLRREESAWLVGSTALVFGAAALCHAVPRSLMSSDSSGMILMGRSLAMYGGFDPALASVVAADFGWFSNYGALVPILQSSAVFLGLEYHPAAAPLMLLSFTATFVCTAILVLRRLGVGPTVAGLYGAGGAALLATTFLYAFQGVYIHNSLPSAIYLFLFVACGWQYTQEQRASWMALALAALLGFILARVEAPLFALLFLTPLLCHPTVDRRTRATSSGVLALVVVFWYFTLYQITPVEKTYMLTPVRNLLISSCVVAFALLMILVPPRRESLLRVLPLGALVVVALGLLALWVARPEGMNHNLTALTTNLLHSGAWQGTWCLIAVLLTLTPVLPRLPSERLFTYGLAAALLLTFVMGGIKNHRMAWGDSQNRMMTHLLPIFLLYLLMKYAAPRTPDADGLTTSNPPRPWIPVALGGILLTGGLLAASPRINYAVQAVTLEAPECVSRYTFEPFMRQKRFVSASERCPSTVVADFGQAVSADVLEMQLNDKAWTPLDYLWQTSADRITWTTLYDSRSGGVPLEWSEATLTYRFDLRPAGRFRYLRYTAREISGENRIVLNHIYVWSSVAGGLSATGRPALYSPGEFLAAPHARINSRGELDWAVGAAPRRAPLALKKHDISRALNGRADAEARFRCDAHDPPDADGLRTIELDLAWTVRADAIEVEAAAADLSRLAWIEVSRDARDWRRLPGPDSAPSAADAQDALQNAAAGLPTPAAVLRRPAPPDGLRFLRLRIGGDGPWSVRRISVLQRVSAAITEWGLPAGRAVAADLACGARVMEAPQCAPGYGVEQALRGVSDGRFVSAVERCPSTIVLDLGAAVQAELLELEQHDEQRSFSDYAWDASPDGQNWVGVFDTRTQGRQPLHLGPTTTGYDLRPVGALRYLRLTVREARGENRVLMNRISVRPSVAWDKLEAAAAP